MQIITDYYAELYNERAAIIEYDGGIDRARAEELAKADTIRQILKNEDKPIIIIEKLKKKGIL